MSRKEKREALKRERKAASGVLRHERPAPPHQNNPATPVQTYNAHPSLPRGASLSLEGLYGVSNHGWFQDRLSHLLGPGAWNKVAFVDYQVGANNARIRFTQENVAWHLVCGMGRNPILEVSQGVFTRVRVLEGQEEEKFLRECAAKMSSPASEPRASVAYPSYGNGLSASQEKRWDEDCSSVGFQSRRNNFSVDTRGSSSQPSSSSAWPSGQYQSSSQYSWSQTGPTASNRLSGHAGQFNDVMGQRHRWS